MGSNLLVKNDSETYRNFISSVDSEVTKKNYRFVFSKFMMFCNIDEGDYDKMLQFDQKTLEGKIRDYTIHLKVDKKFAYNSINLYIAAVSHFYQMNDFVLNWKKLATFKGKRRLCVEDKPYSKEQIRQMLDFADLRSKCIILLMSSAGLRRGGIPGLRIGDLKKMEKYGLYKISVYKKEREAYVTYCTPECTQHLDQYFDWRSRHGEKITAKSPVIRNEFHDTVQAEKARPLAPDTISWLMNNLLDRSGIRPRSAIRLQRTETMECHAHRKYFETTVKTAGIDTLYLKRLMGQNTGLEESYFKPTEDQILEGNDKMIGYIGAIDELTINNENRLKIKIKQMEVREVQHTAEWESVRRDLAEMKKNLRDGRF
jgi:integrase